MYNGVFTPLLTYYLPQVLKKENIYYVVAPFEADAQMTFLAVTKEVDAVITEDSDLIPFGCPRVSCIGGFIFPLATLQLFLELNLD